MVAPYEGLRVLDLSQAIAGPYVGRVLADLGADVVKVEWPRGDVSDVFGRRIGGRSGLYTQMNAGKRGVTADLASAGGRELLRRLADRADVVVENFRTGVLERAGLGYRDLSATNPGVVVLSISGFGATSPERDRQAYAPVIHAESGLLARQSQLDGRPVTDVALALADTLAGLHGAVAVLAALALRRDTGAGQHIDLSMLHAMVASDDYAHAAIDGLEELYESRGLVWDAPGGPILLAPDLKTTWHRAGLPDPSPPGTPLEAKVAARRDALATWIAGFPTRAALVEALAAADLPWADLRTTATVLDSPTLRATGVVARVDDHAGGQRGVVRLPYRFSAAEADVRGPAPAPGEHRDAVLRDWLDQ